MARCCSGPSVIAYRLEHHIHYRSVVYPAAAAGGSAGSATGSRPLFARLGLVWACCYMALGLWQRNEAMEMGYALAAQRGTSPLRLEAKPSFANILVWKVVYETDDRITWMR